MPRSGEDYTAAALVSHPSDRSTHTEDYLSELLTAERKMVALLRADNNALRAELTILKYQRGTTPTFIENEIAARKFYGPHEPQDPRSAILSRAMKSLS